MQQPTFSVEMVPSAKPKAENSFTVQMLPAPTQERPFTVRSPGERRPTDSVWMDQYRVTNELVTWIRANPWKPNNNVKYDGRRKNPLTSDAEHCGLYIGPKLKSKGRSTQIAQVDILVEDTKSKTVDLLIEVEPQNDPKKILGDVLPALLADSYTPKLCDRLEQQRKIQNAVFLFVTVVPDNENSQKRLQLECLEQRVIERLDFKELNVSTIKFCVGNTEADAVQRCKDQIQALLWKHLKGNGTLAYQSGINTLAEEAL